MCIIHGWSLYQLQAMDTGGGALTPEVLGPRPGVSILRIWQGIVEVALRTILALCSICVVAISAAVINDVVESPLSENTLDGASRAAGVFVISLVTLALLIEVVILVLRFLNIGIINLQMKKFFIVDIIISVVLVVGYIVAGLTQGVYAGRWRVAPTSCSASGVFCKDHNWWKLTAAAAVGCFVCAVVAGVLAIWSVLFVVKRWYYKMLQYMSLP